MKDTDLKTKLEACLQLGLIGCSFKFILGEERKNKVSIQST